MAARRRTVTCAAISATSNELISNLRETFLETAPATPLRLAVHRGLGRLGQNNPTARTLFLGSVFVQAQSPLQRPGSSTMLSDGSPLSGVMVANFTVEYLTSISRRALVVDTRNSLFKNFFCLGLFLSFPVSTAMSQQSTSAQSRPTQRDSQAVSAIQTALQMWGGSAAWIKSQDATETRELYRQFKSRYGFSIYLDRARRQFPLSEHGKRWPGYPGERAWQTGTIRWIHDHGSLDPNSEPHAAVSIAGVGSGSGME